MRAEVFSPATRFSTLSRCKLRPSVQIACENRIVLFDRDPKQQGDEIPGPHGLPGDVIVSPDTRRPNRIPPGQSRTKKWPVLDASGPPRIDSANWRLQLSGLLRNEISLTYDQFQKLPRVRVFADFHCVTRWSRLDNVWSGVSTREIARLAGVKPEAKFVLALAYDYGWTTNVPLEYFLKEDSLFAWAHDGQPIAPEHGGPVRLIIPQLYAWKSAKWVKGVRFLEQDQAGFWEEGGYHMRGVPWGPGDGERFRWS